MVKLPPTQSNSVINTIFMTHNMKLFYDLEVYIDSLDLRLAPEVQEVVRNKGLF